MKHSNRHPWYRKIKTRIVAVSLFSGLIPLILIGLFIILKFRSYLTEQDVKIQQDRTASIRQGINILQKSYEKQLQMLARDPRVHSDDLAKLKDVLYQFLDMNPRYSSCFVYDQNGTIKQIAFSNRYQGFDEKYLGVNMLESVDQKHIEVKTAIQKVLQTGVPQVCSQYSYTLKERLLLVMCPIFKFEQEDKIGGMISCAVNVDGPVTDELLAGYPLDPEDVLILADSRGGILASRGDHLPKGMRGLEFSFLSFRDSVSRPSRFVLNEIDYLGVMDYISTINCYILIGRPRSIIMSSLRNVLWNLLLVFIAVIVSVTGMTLMLTRNLALRLDALVEAITLVCDGVVSHRIEHEGDDELSDACEAFNEMASTLEKHRLMNDIWTREWNRDEP